MVEVPEAMMPRNKGNVFLEVTDTPVRFTASSSVAYGGAGDQSDGVHLGLDAQDSLWAHAGHRRVWSQYEDTHRLEGE